MFLFCQLDILISAFIISRTFHYNESDKELNFFVINKDNIEDFVSFSQPNEISFVEQKIQERKWY
jgi:hypothetical protein